MVDIILHSLPSTLFIRDANFSKKKKKKRKEREERKGRDKGREKQTNNKHATRRVCVQPQKQIEAQKNLSFFSLSPPPPFFHPYKCMNELTLWLLNQTDREETVARERKRLISLSLINRSGRHIFSYGFCLKGEIWFLFFSEMKKKKSCLQTANWQIDSKMDRLWSVFGLLNKLKPKCQSTNLRDPRL